MYFAKDEESVSKYYLASFIELRERRNRIVTALLHVLLQN